MLKQYNVKWKKTGNKEGVKPIFKVICPICGNKMIKRNSTLEHETKGGSNFDTTIPYDHIKYKCIRCAFIAPFDIPYENEYWAKTLVRRNDQRLYCPPLKEWAEEDKQVAEQLKSLGYFD